VNKSLSSLFVLILGLALASCGSKEAPADNGTDSGKTPPAVAKAAVDTKAGAEFYATTCTPCHGAGGKGDGAASAALVPKPRDLTSKEWQDSVDDEYLTKIIQYGGGAVGKAATMPGNPVLGSKPEVLESLVAYLRTLSE